MERAGFEPAFCVDEPQPCPKHTHYVVIIAPLPTVNAPNMPYPQRHVLLLQCQTAAFSRFSLDWFFWPAGGGFVLTATVFSLRR